MPFPFATLLDTLRARGLPLGIDDYLAFARLLERWDHTDAAVLREAAGGLLGRNADEVALIKRVFDELFEPAAAPTEPTPPARRKRLRPSTIAIWAGLFGVSLAALIALAAWILFTPTLPQVLPPTLAQPEPYQPVPVRSLEERETTAPRPLPPAPISPPETTNWWLAALALALIFGLVLVLFQQPRASAAERQWSTRAWRRLLGALPGPSRYALAMRDTPVWFDRQHLEDSATLLGRAFRTELLSAALDVPSSVRRTVASGMRPHLLFEPSRATGTLLLLQDVCQEMKVWDRKVEALVAALRRHGIKLERWYFEESPGLVFRAIDDVPMAFEALRRQPAQGLLVVGSGVGLARDVADPDTIWPQQLARWARRSWLNPVTNPASWRAELNALPINVWPLTSAGVEHAARDLARSQEAPQRLRESLRQTSPRVTLDDVERLKRLAAIASSPGVELLELLRQRYAPDVPEDALLHVLAESESRSPSAIVLPPAELRRLAAVERRETPTRERSIRRYVRELLAASEPASGTLAHLRWQLDTAAQDLALAELGDGSIEEAVARMRALLSSPAWEEADAAIEQLRDVGTIGRRFPDRSRGRDRKPVPPALPAGVPAEERSWAWLRPRPRELALGATVAGLTLVALQGTGALKGHTLPHLENAYRLEFVRGDGLDNRAGILRVSIARDEPALPTRVTLKQGADDFGDALHVPPGGSATVDLPIEESGHYYQASGTLPQGNAALSNVVWVPAMGSVAPLTVNALPWAEVRILDPETRLLVVGDTFTTPFVIELREGRYVLEFSYQGLTRPVQREILVQPGAPNEVLETMPGFDAEEIIRQIIGTGAPRAQNRER